MHVEGTTVGNAMGSNSILLCIHSLELVNLFLFFSFVSIFFCIKKINTLIEIYIIDSSINLLACFQKENKSVIFFSKSASNSCVNFADDVTFPSNVLP